MLAYYPATTVIFLMRTQLFSFNIIVVVDFRLLLFQPLFGQKQFTFFGEGVASGAPSHQENQQQTKCPFSVT
jgi:hypothetical protein